MFGRGAGFAYAVGELSILLEGLEEGFSINAPPDRQLHQSVVQEKFHSCKE